VNIKDRFDLVIFDWAGTIVDFGCQAPLRALIETFAREGVTIDTAAARRDMGKPKIDHVKALLAYAPVATAWHAAKGRDANAGDIARIMDHLGPLMREYASGASRLIPGAKQTFDALRAAGVRVASSTGYTRDMMEPVIRLAAEQGYAPETVVCSGETPFGRPTPLMIYKICAELGVWPLNRVVKVDDAVAGIEEGKAAGAFTVGVASGNELALSLADLTALPVAERTARLAETHRILREAGADVVLDSVADLVPALSLTPGTGSERRPGRP
jgi:phosphonoacetaldehyde hydrolase